MPFDFAFDEPLETAASTSGRLNYQAGLAAEDCVLHRYIAQGAEVLARRWRGQAGEIDLVLRQGDDVVCVDVKKAATCEAAAERLTFTQLGRIASAAEEFVGTLADGLLTPLRIDAALVGENGDIDVIENIPLS